MTETLRLEWTRLPQHLYAASDWIVPPPVQRVLASDAMEKAWGAVDLSAQPNSETFGFWEKGLQEQHIMAQETEAAVRAIKSLAQPGERVRVFADATVAVSMLNKGGSNRSLQLNSILEPFWRWTKDNQISVTAAYIPGQQNPADRPSRTPKDHNDWFLNRRVLFLALKTLRLHPTLDMFASFQHHQFPRYFSRFPQPGCLAVDALRQVLSNFKDSDIYANPLWPLLPILSSLYGLSGRINI